MVNLHYCHCSSRTSRSLSMNVIPTSYKLCIYYWFWLCYDTDETRTHRIDRDASSMENQRGGRFYSCQVYSLGHLLGLLMILTISQYGHVLLLQTGRRKIKLPVLRAIHLVPFLLLTHSQLMWYGELKCAWCFINHTVYHIACILVNII